MKTTARLFATTLFTLAGLVGVAHADGRRPVVVELFTSQGCSSCPGADAILAELADRPDVLALSYHVDYWNYIGWPDPFSNALNTERQRAYGRVLKARYVYTPQVVVDGAVDVVGSDRARLDAALVSATDGAQGGAGAIALDLQIRDGGYHLSLDGAPRATPLSLWLVGWDDRHETEILRGENRGKHLVNRHVVRSLSPLGNWQGGRLDMQIDTAALMGDGGVAVLLQEDGVGPVRAVTWLKK